MEAKKVTIIGSGLIGRSWALVRTIKFPHNLKYYYINKYNINLRFLCVKYKTHQ